MSSDAIRYVKNAISNLVRGASGGLIALVLPYVLFRWLPKDICNVWFLVFAISTYTGFLDFGLQTAVGRFVAQANERQDDLHRNQVVSTGLALLCVMCLIAMAVIGLLAGLLPHIAPESPVVLYQPARVALLVLGISTAAGLPASAFVAVFIGMQRYDVPAAIIGAGRLIGLALVVGYIVTHGRSMVAMAWLIATANYLTYAVEYVAVCRLEPRLQVARGLIKRTVAHEILGYSFALAVWSVVMLLVTRLDTVLVARFEMSSVACYAAAASLTAMLATVQTSVFTILIPQAAVLNVREDAHRLGHVLLSSTRYGAFILLAIGLPLIAGAGPLMRLWLGPSAGPHTALMVQILVLASIIRLSAVPYASVLIGTGQQRRMILIALIEAAVNVTSSVALGAAMGAVGVAYGALIGAAVAFAGNLFYNMPRTTAVAISVRRYVASGILRPALCLFPLVLAAACGAEIAINAAVRTGSIIVAFAVSCVFAWHWGIDPGERNAVRAVLDKLARRRA